MTQLIIEDNSSATVWFRAIIDYTVETNSGDTYKVNASCSLQLKSPSWVGDGYASCSYSNNQNYFYISLGSSKQQIAIPTFSNKNISTSSWTTIASTGSVGTLSYTVTKNHNTQTLKFGITAASDAYVYANESPGESFRLFSLSDLSATHNVTVPVRTSYTVSFNANGGSGAPGNQTKWYGENLTLSSTRPTLSGYSFKRWNTNTSDTGTGYAPSGTYSANSAATLYAIWNRTVTYNANNGTGQPPAQTEIKTKAITLSSTIPTKTGYTFRYWNTKSDGSGTTYQPGGTYAANNPSVTLYAIWWKNPEIWDVSVDRCDSSGNTTSEHSSHLLAGYLKLRFKWKITTPQLGETMTQPSSFTVKLGNTTVYNTVPSTTQEDDTPRSIIIGDGNIKPDEAYTLTIKIVDNHSNTEYSITASKLPEVQYSRPFLYNAQAVITDSAGTRNALGKYILFSVEYGAHAIDIDNERAYVTINNDNSKKILLDSTSGTVSWLEGPYTYLEFDPNGNQVFGSVKIWDDWYDETISNVKTSLTDYFTPEVTNLTVFRSTVEDGQHYESDDGDQFGFDIAWNVYKSIYQAEDLKLTINLKEKESQTVVCTREIDIPTVIDLEGDVEDINNRVFTGSRTIFIDGDVNEDTYEDPMSNPPLFLSAERQYLLEIILSDDYTEVVTTGYGERSDLLTIAFFTMDFLGDYKYYIVSEDTVVDNSKHYYLKSGSGSTDNPYTYSRIIPVGNENPSELHWLEGTGEWPGHGVAFGKPATREGLDVGMPAYFDAPISVAELSTLPVYTQTGNSPVVANLPEIPCLVLCLGNFSVWHYDGVPS